MAGMDYDITDPGTRGLMMLQAFNARMAGRDGLMEAYKLGEIEREKRKQAAVQQHSMGLLSGMLSGSDPRQLFAQFPLADPGTMSNLVASKVAEDRAARERAAQEQMTIRAEQRAAEDDRKKAQAATIAGDTYLRLSKGATKQLGPLEATPSTGPMRQESNVSEPPPAPEFQNPIEQMLRSPIGGVAAQGNAPFNFQPQPGMAVEQVIPPLPPEQITAEAIKAQNPGIDERGIQPGIDAAQKRIEFMRKQEGDDTLEAASIILDNGPDNYELSMGLIRERGLNVNPTKLKAVLSTSPEWVKATSQAGAGGAAEGRLEVASSPEGRAQAEWLQGLRTNHAQKIAEFRSRAAQNLMSPEDLDFQAEMYLAGYPVLGVGRSKEAVAYLNQRIRQIAEERGITPDQVGELKARYQAGSFALKQDTRLADSLKMSLDKVKRQVEIVRQYSGDYKRLNSLILNRGFDAAMKFVAGDEDAISYISAMKVLQPEYARLINGNGMAYALQQNQLALAQQIVNTELPHAALMHNLDLMLQEADASYLAVVGVANYRAKNPTGGADVSGVAGEKPGTGKSSIGKTGGTERPADAEELPPGSGNWYMRTEGGYKLIEGAQ